MTNTSPQPHCSGAGQEQSQSSIALPVIPSAGAIRVRESRTSRWRAVSLIAVHVFMLIHIVHWLVTGSTLSPIEPSEAMYTLNHGYLNAGMIFFSVAILSTLIFGRFVCGWGCHLIAYQDLCSWLLKKIGIKPKPFRSRILLLGPLALAIYMFVWPTAYRWVAGHNPPTITNHFMTSEFWATFPGPFVAVLTIVVCGFVIVYFLGSKGFCTYACPYGGFFSLADQVSPGKILVTDACEHCGHCTAVCTSNVRVHEEVATFGMVVDPGCMKCMDCISVCPNDALHFGFSTPSLIQKPDKPRKSASTDFTLKEEVFMVAIGLISLLIYRGLYGQLPLLLSMGIGALTAYLLMKFIQILRDTNVRLQNLSLKRGGKLTHRGTLFCVAFVLYSIFTIHSAMIHYHTYTGQKSIADLQLGDDIWEQSFNWWDHATLTQQERINETVQKFEWVDRWGLFTTVSVLKDLTWLYLARNEIDQAEKIVYRMIEVLPDHEEPYRGLAGVLRKTGRMDEAVVQYRKALRIKPSYKSVRAELCALLVSLGRMEEALAEFRKAVQVEPASADAHYNLAMALMNQRNISEAVVHLQKTVELNPNGVLGHYNLGVATFMTGKITDAVPHIQTAIQLKPDDPDAYGFLAVVLEQLGDVEGAQQAADKAKQLQIIPRKNP